jgi:hypothetical protein
MAKDGIQDTQGQVKAPAKFFQPFQTPKAHDRMGKAAYGSLLAELG